MYTRILIIGGGFTGLCAKLFLANYNIDCKVMDNGDNNVNYLIKNYCGFDSIYKKDLILKIHRQISIYDNNYIIHNNAIRVDYNSQIIVHCSDNKTYECEYLLICNGFTYKRLPNTEKYHFVTEHLDDNDIIKYNNKIIVIIGGGDRSITYFESIKEICKYVVVLCRSNIAKINHYQHYKLIIYNNVLVKKIDNYEIIFLNKKSKENISIKCDFIIVAIGIESNKIPVFKDNIEYDIYSNILSGCNETILDNIFLGGVVKKTPYQQIINVMNDGSIFAMEMNKRILNKEDTYY